MNKKTLLTIGKSIILILILFAFVFALRAPAADLNYLPDDAKADYIDSHGLPYFSEMDSYYNFRLTNNYITTGHVGDVVVNGTEMDTHRYAPDNQEVDYEMGIVYVTSAMYDFANGIGNGIFGLFAGHGGSYDVREVAFWTGALISCLAVIPAFIFARRLTGNYGAVVAALLIALAPNYFAHTYPGFFDTDMFYFIFALFFIFFFMESLRTRNIILKIVFAVLSIGAIGLFSISWTGYVFYIAVMGLFSIVYLILCYVLKIGNGDPNKYPSRISWFLHQKDLYSIILLGVIGFVILGVTKGIDGITGLFGQFNVLVNLQSTSAIVGGFPNVLISVAEMQKPALVGSGKAAAFLANSNGVINGIGGIIVLFAGLIVLYTLATKLWKLRSAKVKSNVDVSKKPHKSKRKSSAKRIDDKHKLKISLSSLQEFSSHDEIESSRRITLMYTTLFVVWTLTSIIAVTQGSRFITTLVLPFGLMAGMFTGYAVSYIKDTKISDNWLMFIIVLGAVLGGFPIVVLNNILGLAVMAIFIALGAIFIFGIKNKKTATSTNVPIKKWIAIALVIITLVSPTVCGAYQTSNQVVPGTNDAMWNSLEWINENTPENTVVTSWWDFGYLFEVAADRQVTFDGGSQTGERAFWLGKAMTTDNLELSAGIFRMLDTTGDKAVEQLNNYTGDSGKTTSILCDILPMTAGDAKNTLVNKYHLSGSQADSVVKYTHPANPRPVIFVASSDMLQKAGWWSYFGSWNFENQSSENYQYFIPTSPVNVNPGQTVKYPILSESGITYNIVIQRGAGNNTTTAHTEAVITDSGEPLKVNDSVYNPLNASHLIVIENNQMMKNQTISGVDGNYTIFLMAEGNSYTPILMSNILRDSMFTRLYLEGGYNQDIFTQVHMENGVSLWQVNFNNTVAGGAGK
ncbi:MAG: STT3 domain-containing protein [Methanobrevibacter sp.]|uniref:STT3 domain-containing protein n=1 Tax=Methanobrevibacter sp. TaxID=66852 RepID=UPI0026DF7FC4|nr:STT3 domain-containing protein [Methanobrevibacter sp.]MDO5848538.1 STT3 domain-containing protein [Methanobrevibacter sp.]